MRFVIPGQVPSGTRGLVHARRGASDLRHSWLEIHELDQSRARERIDIGSSGTFAARMAAIELYKESSANACILRSSSST
jgi:hypothetical protein